MSYPCQAGIGPHFSVRASASFWEQTTSLLIFLSTVTRIAFQRVLGAIRADREAEMSIACPRRVARQIRIVVGPDCHHLRPRDLREHAICIRRRRCATAHSSIGPERRRAGCEGVVSFR